MTNAKAESVRLNDMGFIGRFELPDLDLSDFVSDWRNETENSPHKDTLSITLRGLPEPIDADAVFNELEAVNYPALNEDWKELLLRIGYTLGAASIRRAMLVLLKPGGEVTPHADEGEYCGRFLRFHLPIVTNEECLNTFGDTTGHLEQGCLYFVNNLLEHSAVNNGQTPRVHLIVDVELM